MIEYLVMRIKNGALTYEYIIKCRPDLKERLDAELINQGLEKLISASDKTQPTQN